MKMLRDKDLKIFYNTDEDDIVNDFYCKTLQSCKLYKRAVAYFSSSSLLPITKGIESLIYNGGKMKLLISPNLSQEDIRAINIGYLNREEVISNFLMRNFNLNDEYKNQYNYLAWLIYEEKLDIKVVVKKDCSKIGLFHEKLGIIEDSVGDRIAFNGSMNETGSAFLNNYESINIFRSWDDSESLRVDIINNNFDDIWENRSNKWSTFDFPNALKENILKIRSSIKPSYNKKNSENVDDINLGKPSIPDFIKLRDYQKEAIKKWFNSKGKGIFEMATGTGKTITAISAITKVLQICSNNNKSCGVVIVVPYKALLEQWVENLLIFNINPIRCYENKQAWHDKLNDAIYMFNNSITNNLFVITTNSTFNSISFQKLLRSVEKDYVFCIDEMHHAATDLFLSNLPDECKLRLGLSATLQSNNNQEKMDDLKEYFGEVIFKFPLDRAIKEGFLTEYYYYPIFVELTEEEKYEYFELTSKIGRLLNVVSSDDESLTSLLMKRARIVASSKNKLIELKKLRNKITDTKYNIFYCGDKIEGEDKFIHKVNRIVAHDFGLKTHTFTSEENKCDRERILRDFSSGALDAISAIRCLDEGIDIPQLRRAFILSSSTNPKEFIQRRGRILRLCKGKEFAEIYDFIVVPSLNKDYIKQLSYEELSCERKILLREVKRFDEFAKLAINNIEANKKLLEIWNLYDISDGR